MIYYITTDGIGNAWVANELNEIRRAGIPFVLCAMRKPKKSFHLSDWAGEMDRQTRCIYPLPVLGVLVSVMVAPFLFGGRFFACLANALFGERESFRARVAGIAHLAVACHWARGLRGEKVSHIHSQWIHSCGTIGMYGSWLLGVSFSFTGHATDLFRDRSALKDKIRRAQFIVCISTFHRDFFLQNGARPEQLHIVYCGIDPSLFHPKADAAKAGGAFRIRASGRLVEKKGLEYLVEACKILRDRGVGFECVIAGSGPEEKALRDQIAGLGLNDRVTVTGQALAQEKIPEFMHSGDLYCLPCVWASDNDVDGLPQMLMEAMACGLPVISTRLVGIPDLVIDGQTGVLVEPNNAQQLADAIAGLMNDPAKLRRLAEAGNRWVREKFDLRTCLEPLLNQYRAKLNMPIVVGRPGDRPQQKPVGVGGALST